MTSEASNPEVGAAIDQINAGFDALFAAGIAPSDVTDATTRIREIEALGRRAFAAEVELLSDIDRAGLHRVDGHASAKVMVRHVARLSDVEAKRRISVAKTLRDLPEVRERLQAGRIGVCQARRIGRAHANPRVRQALLGKDRSLARLAEMESYERFDAKLTDWVRRVDEDGTADRNQRNHENRDAKLVQDYDESWMISGGCASLDGAQLHDIFRHFVKAENLADWEKARAEHGDAATPEHLPRTERQRRFDALLAIFHRAASAVEAAGGPQIVTNIVMDLATFERHAARFAGADPGEPDVSLDDDLDRCDGDGGPVTTRESTVRSRCSHLDGRLMEAREAVARALVGQIRRVVVGGDGVVIDLGRRQRLFTGSAALAVKLSATHCYWPGCHVPVSQCQSDHLIPWADHGGGSTDPGNGGPACGRHNRLKEHGFSVTRDETGTWHVTRPDGVEIT